MLDLQTYLHNAVDAQRRETLGKSDQLTLGEMILKMETIVEKERHRLANNPRVKDEVQVYYDFGYLYPTHLMSWRGIYKELAMDYYYREHGGPDAREQAKTATQFLAMLKGAVGTEFTGYKGGEFRMDRHTPVWVSNYGESCHTAVIDIVYDEAIQVIIITGYRES